MAAAKATPARVSLLPERASTTAQLLVRPVVAPTAMPIAPKTIVVTRWRTDNATMMPTMAIAAIAMLGLARPVAASFWRLEHSP